VRRQAYQKNNSIASIVRHILQKEISGAIEPQKRTVRSFSFIGSGRSRGKGTGKVSKRHDEELQKSLSL
jgi:hypothetical protein